MTNFESDKPPAEFANLYKEDELVGGHVIMLGADPASEAAALEALRAYPGEKLRICYQVFTRTIIHWICFLCTTVHNCFLFTIISDISEIFRDLGVI